MYTTLSPYSLHGSPAMQEQSIGTKASCARTALRAGLCTGVALGSTLALQGNAALLGMSPHTSLRKEGTPGTGHTTSKELSSPGYKSRLLVSATGMGASPSAEQLLPWLGKEMRPVVLVCHPPGLREAYSHTSWS